MAPPTLQEQAQDPAQLSPASGARPTVRVFLISGLLLFLELACIRWFPARVLFLTYFTNTVLLACFLGMSIGCLAAGQACDYIVKTPLLLAIAMAAAQLVELQAQRLYRVVDVGNQNSPQLVFFGTEYGRVDPAKFSVPIEFLCGVFFALIALSMVGPGQELGRALKQVPNRVQAYSSNILGSIAGILLFAACSLWSLPPRWWFTSISIGLAFLIIPRWQSWPARRMVLVLLSLICVTWFALPGVNSTGVHQTYWSPYYRIDYNSKIREIWTNLIGHQSMVSRDTQPLRAATYDLPYALRRDAGAPTPGNVLIIGAGSGNDVSAALRWGAAHVDAVEIDPLIQQLGARYHPEHPYQDPRVSSYIEDGRQFLRQTDRHYDVIVFALVDSLVLHSSYSSIRLESYLFTRDAFADVRRHLSPGGMFAMYNIFRRGWIDVRLQKLLQTSFGPDSMVFPLPYQARVAAESPIGFTLFLAGDISRLRDQFNRSGNYAYIPDAPDHIPNGFDHHAVPNRASFAVAPAEVEVIPNLRVPTDEWPFLYLRSASIPGVSLRGIAVMATVAFCLLAVFMRRDYGGITRSGQILTMFFLGAGFMLIETKAVVQMALLFGSTWMVNCLVFTAVLLMILLANLWVMRRPPQRLWPVYALLFCALIMNVVVALNAFLGMQPLTRTLLSCLLTFSPIFFAGIVFATLFNRSTTPHVDFGANVAGAMIGGFAEYASMLVGFRLLIVLAAAFYALSALSWARFGRRIWS